MKQWQKQIVIFDPTGFRLCTHFILFDVKRGMNPT